MPFGIGVWEIAVLLLVAVLVFGPKRMPEMGRSLGRGMREFKDTMRGFSLDDERPPARRDAEGVTVSAAPRERDST